MSCDPCKEQVGEVAKSARLMSEMVQTYDRQNRRLWASVIVLCVCLVVTSVCMLWAVSNAQRLANEAVLNALNSVAEIGVTQETTTTTTQTVEGDSATINNVDGEQYNDEAVNGGGE